MLANERYNIILEILKNRRSVAVSELTQRFGVSIETIRRDLATLERKGLLERVHGGAVSISDQMRGMTSLHERLTENQDLKRELSLKAAELICENDIIAVDAGSTAIEFAKVLCEKFERLNIITYSRDVIDIISEKPNFKLTTTGGEYLAAERVFHGFLAIESLKKLHVSKSFLFPSAISTRYGITINTGEFYELHTALMSISDTVFILADSSKFETTSPIKVCEISSPNAIITDSKIDDMLLQLYVENGAKIYMGENKYLIQNDFQL